MRGSIKSEGASLPPAARLLHAPLLEPAAGLVSLGLLEQAHIAARLSQFQRRSPGMSRSLGIPARLNSPGREKRCVRQQHLILNLVGNGDRLSKVCLCLIEFVTFAR